MYSKNVVLFVQCFQSLVTFWDITLVKTNIATSLLGSPLEWYTSELSNFDRNTLNNNPGMKSWINTISHCFKVPTSVAFGLFTNETYFLDDAQARQPLAKYVCAIIQHSIRCNIIHVANQLSFAYQGIAQELWVFVLQPTDLIKADNFICMLEEKQEIWHEMMTTLEMP